MSQTLRLALPTMASLLVVVMLTGCSHSASKPAPIGSVDGMNSAGSMKSVGSVNASNNSTGQQQWLTPPSIVYQRNYQQIPKGSYNNKTYQVKRGDTLFYIAWITGNDYRELAQRNNIAPPYGLAVGQTLQVGEDISKSGPDIHHVTQNSQIATKKLDSQTNNAYPYNPGNKGTAAQSKPTASATASSSQTALQWRWPAQGKIIDGFSSSAQGNKGIDIAGSKGETVRAAAAGRVVYAGNALRGYGNLIIIKHDDDYLSAYAHNDAILVKEQQQIQAGQQIATMGNTGSTSVRLHFEIRYKGKSVNPLQYLPQR